MDQIPPGALVVLSGGQDSTTCLFHILQTYKRVHCLTIDYGQRHSRELAAARAVVEIARLHYRDATIEHMHLAVGAVLAGASPLVNIRSTLEQYEDWKTLPGGIEKTFVPMRNQLFLTLAANRAVVHNCAVIVTGVSQEDYGGYPDCRDTFIRTLTTAINQSLAGVHVVDIVAPLMYVSKAASVIIAKSLPGCWEALAHSHTSYDGSYPPTGHDHATLLRAKGFFEAGEADPLVVRAWQEGVMDLPATSNYDAVRPRV